MTKPKPKIWRVYCDDETVAGLPCSHPSACDGHEPRSPEARWLIRQGAGLIETKAPDDEHKGAD